MKKLSALILAAGLSACSGIRYDNGVGSIDASGVDFSALKSSTVRVEDCHSSFLHLSFMDSAHSTRELADKHGIRKVVWSEYEFGGGLFPWHCLVIYGQK